jgi:putative transposase
MTPEMLLEEEPRELVSVGRWQKALGCRDRRNGPYLRGLMTSMGHIEVAVPCIGTSGSADYLLGRYKRRFTPENLEKLAGVSTNRGGL